MDKPGSSSETNAIRYADQASTRKEIARSFLERAARGDVKAAFDQYVADDFLHHNPWFRGDANSLMRGMEENARKYPNKVFEIQRTIAEGDLVAVHSHVQMRPDELGAAVVHIMRFRLGRIAELWDVGQQIPADGANRNGMF